MFHLGIHTLSQQYLTVSQLHLRAISMISTHIFHITRQKLQAERLKECGYGLQTIDMQFSSQHQLYVEVVYKLHIFSILYTPNQQQRLLSRLEIGAKNINFLNRGPNIKRHDCTVTTITLQNSSVELINIFSSSSLSVCLSHCLPLTLSCGFAVNSKQTDLSSKYPLH